MGGGSCEPPPPWWASGERGCHCLEGPHCGADLGSDPFARGATVRPSEVGVPLLHVAAPLDPVGVACGAPGVVRVETNVTTDRGEFCHAEFDAFCVGEVDHGVSLAVDLLIVAGREGGPWMIPRLFTNRNDQNRVATMRSRLRIWLVRMNHRSRLPVFSLRVESRMP